MEQSAKSFNGQDLGVFFKDVLVFSVKFLALLSANEQKLGREVGALPRWGKEKGRNLPSSNSHQLL